MNLTHKKLLETINKIPEAKLLILTPDNLKEIQKSFSITYIESNLYKIDKTEVFILVSLYAPKDKILGMNYK